MGSIYPRLPKMSALVLQASLNRKGLVADAIFPKVRTACAFKYVDWTNAATVKLVEDAIGCKTDVKEIDPDAFTLKDASTQDRALQISMGECCLESCGDVDLAELAEKGKTMQLTNSLLVGREKRAIALAVDESKYTANGTSGAPVVPGASNAVNEGGLYYLTKANLANSSFALLQWFLPIQTNNFLTGVRTVAIMSQATLNKFLVHPNFLGAGCIVGSMTTKEAVAALLGVREIIVADSAYQSGSNAAWTKLWNDDYIFLSASYNFLTAQDPTPAFGISAYTRNWAPYYYKKEEKGPTDGVVMQKQSHDETEVVLTYKAATLIKLV